MIYASGVSLSAALNDQERADGWLYPDINRIREVSVVVTRYVIRAAQQNGVDRELSLRALSDAELDEYVERRMYDPFKERDSYLDEIAHMVGQHGGLKAGASHL
jgi:malate dehydrogenase (oxaloacetate-decarboxylating)(NADP+)